MADVRLLNIDLNELPAADIPAVLTQLAAAQSVLAARLLIERHVVQPDATVAGKLLTVEEAAGRTGMSKRWLYTHAQNLPFAVRVGRSLRFSEAGLDRWVRSRSGRG
jgi:excisionase family DNA binding protein